MPSQVSLTTSQTAEFVHAARSRAHWGVALSLYRTQPEPIACNVGMIRHCTLFFLNEMLPNAVIDISFLLEVVCYNFSPTIKKELFTYIFENSLLLKIKVSHRNLMWETFKNLYIELLFAVYCRWPTHWGYCRKHHWGLGRSSHHCLYRNSSNAIKTVCICFHHVYGQEVSYSQHVHSTEMTHFKENVQLGEIITVISTFSGFFLSVQ